MTKVRLDARGTSTTLESNKSVRQKGHTQKASFPSLTGMPRAQSRLARCPPRTRRPSSALWHTFCSDKQISSHSHSFTTCVSLTAGGEETREKGAVSV